MSSRFWLLMAILYSTTIYSVFLPKMTFINYILCQKYEKEVEL